MKLKLNLRPLCSKQPAMVIRYPVSYEWSSGDLWYVCGRTRGGAQESVCRKWQENERLGLGRRVWRNKVVRTSQLAVTCTQVPTRVALRVLSIHTCSIYMFYEKIENLYMNCK